MVSDISFPTTIVVVNQNAGDVFVIATKATNLPTTHPKTMTSTGALVQKQMPTIVQLLWSWVLMKADAMRRSSVASRKKLQNDLRIELRVAIFQARDAFRRIKLFEQSLIPKGQQAQDVAMNDYAAGKVGFMALIDAQRTLLEFKIMREKALADSEKALAEIGCCVGKFSSPLDFLKNAVRTEAGS